VLLDYGTLSPAPLQGLQCFREVCRSSLDERINSFAKMACRTSKEMKEINRESQNYAVFREKDVLLNIDFLV